MSDAGQDEDYVPSSRKRSQLKKKRRASRVLSTGSVQPARRVRLADIVSGTVPRPPTLQDSHGRDYAPPVISASRTLESRYSICLLAISIGVGVHGCGWVKPNLPLINGVCCISSC